MKILLSLLAVVALVLYRVKGGRVLASLVVVLAVAALVSVFVGSGKPGDADQVGSWAPEVGLGDYLGRTVRDMVPEGGVVLVVTRSADNEEDFTNESLIGGLTRGAGKGIEFVGFDLPQELVLLWFETSMAADILTKEIFDLYLKSYPDVAAIISMAGLPDCSPEALSGNIPPLLVCTDEDDFVNEQWRSSGLVKMEIVSLPFDGQSPPDDSFEARYEVIVGDAPAGS